MSEHNASDSMGAGPSKRPASPSRGWTRRQALRALGLGGAGLAAGTALADSEQPAGTLKDALGDVFQDHFQRMTPEEVRETLARLERRYKARFKRDDIHVEATPPIPGVVYGYALDLTRCKGYRECVRACIEENNQGRDGGIEYIRVLEMPRDTRDMSESDHYYDHEVPAEDKYYLPVQCQHCADPPCVKACPVEATWEEPDGIVVVDYNWCIGCRFCMAACPYWARHFNWEEPKIPAKELNPNMHYLGNRPRMKGVMEKCTFCIQRVRKGRMPACQEACPNGARIFGNLLDPNSEIRWVLEHKPVFRLKEDLKTEPKFWYFFS